MKPTILNVALLVVLSVALLIAPVAIGPEGARAGESHGGAQYICPPCDAEHDGEVYDKPGSCPVCGMKLIKKKEIKNVAILIFDGVQIIDYTGPYEVFGQAGFDVFTVSETGETITTTMGMSVNPRYNFSDSPQPTVLVIPGGGVHDQYGNPKVLDWIRAQAEKAEYVLTVCNGAFILAKTGLLDGLSATTFYGLIDELETFAPEVEVVSDQRYVDNGKFITTAGLSSGIDGSLHVLTKMLGKGRTEGIALHLEYDWRPDSDFARAAFADRLMPDHDLPDGVSLQLVSTRGDRDQWEARYLVEGDLSASKVFAEINGQLEKHDTWSKIGSSESNGTARTNWNFIDKKGDAWSCETILESAPAGGSGPVLAYRIQRREADPVATGSATIQF